MTFQTGFPIEQAFIDDLRRHYGNEVERRGGYHLVDQNLFEIGLADYLTDLADYLTDYLTDLADYLTDLLKH